MPPSGLDPDTDEEPGAGLLELSSVRGRVLLATVALGSGIAMLDGTVVNIALREIGFDLDASLAELQWVSTGYLLSLASLILVGGALGDRLGRRRIYLLGVIGFAAGSALCAFAQSPVQLGLFRVLQGAAAALLVPGALALIQSSFRRGGPAGSHRHLGGRRWRGNGGRPAHRWLPGRQRRMALDLRDQPAAVRARGADGHAGPESRDESVTGRFDVAGAVAGAWRWGSRRTC